MDRVDTVKVPEPKHIPPKNIPEAHHKLGLSLQKIFNKHQRQYSNEFILNLKQQQLCEEFQNSSAMHGRQQQTKKRLAALNLAYLLERKVDQQYMSFWHPMQVNNLMREKTESRSSELFRLDEEYVLSQTMSFLETRSRSCSFDQLSISKNSSASILVKPH